MVAARQQGLIWNFAFLSALLFAVPAAARDQNQDGASSPADQTESTCPPQYSSLAVFALGPDDGSNRKPEKNEYWHFLRGIADFAGGGEIDEEVVRNSIAAAARLADQMTVRGHEMTVPEIIIHSETLLNRMLSGSTGVHRGRFELQLAIVLQIKARICR